MITSDERGHYLDFEQAHWKVHIHFVQLENLMEMLNKKQGNINQTEQLFHEFRVCREKERDKSDWEKYIIYQINSIIFYREGFMMKK